MNSTATYLFIFSCLFQVSTSLFAQDYSVGLGYGIVEQGDDRISPTVNLNVGVDDWQLGYYFYGRTFGPVYQKTHTLAFSRRFPVKLFSSEKLGAKIGLGYLLQTTVVAYTKDKDASFNNSENSSNFGALLGVNYIIWTNAPFIIELNWESLIMPAGESGILLATGRKEYLLLGARANI